MALSFIEFDQEHNAAQFRVDLIKNLATKKGLISDMFSEMEPVVVLMMLSRMGENDALSFQNKEKRRVLSYIESKQVPQKFRKMMKKKQPCTEFLVGWFTSVLLKEGEITKSEFLKGYDYFNHQDTGIKLVEKLLQRNDLWRTYVSLGCLIGTDEIYEYFSEFEIDKFLKCDPAGSTKPVLQEYLEIIRKRIQESTTGFRSRVSVLKQECQLLAAHYEEAVDGLKEYFLPKAFLTEATIKLSESFNALKSEILGKLGADENESLESIQSLEAILDRMEQKENKFYRETEQAVSILKKARLITVQNGDHEDFSLKTFKEKIDLIIDKIADNRETVQSILAGDHQISKLLRLVETKEEPGAKDLGILLLGLQAFCGPEDSNTIIGNLAAGKIALSGSSEEAAETNPAVTDTALTQIEMSIQEEATETPDPESGADPENEKHGLVELQKEDEHVGEQSLKEVETGEKTEVFTIGELLTSRDYAGRISASPDSPELDILLWTLIYEDDLAGAYWLSKAIEFKNGSSTVPPWMIMAIQGSRWISSDSGSYVETLLEIAKAHRPGKNYVDCILGLAASIRPALIQPDSGLIDWLQKPERCPQNLARIVDSIKDFSKYGRAIMPDDVTGVAGFHDLSTRIEEISASANRWMKDAATKKAKIKIATEVWRQLTGPNGELREFLRPVIMNDRENVQTIREGLHQWQKLDFIDQKIDHITEEVSKLRTRKIVGSPRQTIIRNIGDACDIAYNWCQLIDREHEHKKKGSKLIQQIKILRKEIAECIPGLRESFRELTSAAEPAATSMSFACLARSVDQLLRDLNVHPDINLMESPGTAVQWISKDSRNLEESISRRLILIPEYASLHDLDLIKENTDEFIKIFCNSIRTDMSLDHIVQVWIESQDYRYIEQLRPALDEKIFDEVQKKFKNALNDSEQLLREILSFTTSYIEQALVDGVITEELHAQYKDVLQSIELSRDLNFKRKYDDLSGIRNQIESQREQRLSELVIDWDRLQEQMEKSSSVSAQKWQVSNFIQDALSRKDTRVVEECLAHLREVFDKGINLEESLFKVQKRTDYLSEFLDAVPKIKSWIESKGLHDVVNTIQNGVLRAGINYGSLPKRHEIASAVKSWIELKRKKPNSARIESDIADILMFMGFTLEFKDGAQPVQIQDDGLDWLVCTANMSAGEASRPIPQYGSMTRNRYEIICLWERPGVDTMAARLRELRLTSGSVIVLFLGRLYDRQRKDLVRISRDKIISAALLDEILFLHLTRERDAINRLHMFLRGSLPYTSLNPYTPFQAGDVPPEMFFGRGEMITELQKMGGSCIVYGGRQLGKSALLRCVQREFHNPRRDQYAAVIDIKLLGDPKTMQPISYIWGRIREKLKGMGFLRHITTDRSEEIRKYIKDILNQNNKRKLILFFDEADNFLESDAKDNFREVNEFRLLMLESEYRFKVVFAGLQNVQRFQGIPNQPLAHFGTPIRVGPLEADAAMQLVSEPLQALGYRMGDDRTTILRILSYTNYHPGLIQLFCQELLRRLESQTGNSSPPFTVRQEDVEAVYRLDEVRQRIRERFDWTLALNSRYQAIAWLMVLDQLEKRDSYSRAYPPGNILSIVRDWWAEGFGEFGLDELRGLLDEMCGLGVLVRNSAGHYRLRSPNLVRLLGTDEDILNSLDELSKKKAPLPFDADNYHVPLDTAASAYSPMTYFQERNLNKPGSGTSLIFSSDALGLTNVKLALKKFVSTDAGSSSGLFTEMPAEILCAETLHSWLAKHLDSNSKYENLLVFKAVYEMDNADMASCIKQAINFCNRYQSKKKWIRIFFVFDHQATWKWLTLPGEFRRELEESSDSSIYTRKWNREGLKQRFAHHDKINKDNFLTDALKTTNGWPYLLDTLFERCGSHDDVRPYLKIIDTELKEPDSILRNMFLNALGVQDNAVSKLILNYLKSFDANDPVPVELLRPDYIGKNDLNDEHCLSGIEFLERMNCIEIQNNAVLLDPIVRSVIP